MDVSIIIFLGSLIGIIGMLVFQYRKLKASGGLDGTEPRALSYETFKTFGKKLSRLWLIVLHGTAVIGTRAWARTTHYTSATLKKGLKKIEDRIMQAERSAATGERRSQSVFLTTIKTYKHEIKKLQGRAEEELPRPRVEASHIDDKAKISTIKEPSSEGTPE